MIAHSIATPEDFERILTSCPTDDAGRLLKLLVATNPSPEIVGEAVALVERIRAPRPHLPRYAP